MSNTLFKQAVKKLNDMTDAELCGFVEATPPQWMGKNEILDALKSLVADVKSKPNDTRYATRLKEAEEVIKKYDA